MSQAGLAGSSGGGALLETLTGNTGGAVPPTGNNINTVGTGSITIAGSPGTSTLTTQLTGLTNHNVLVGAGTATITNVAPSTAGFVLTSNGAAADPSFQAVSASGAITTITGDSGGAEVPSSGNFNILGTGSITVAGSANTETVQLTGLTNHNVLVGAGTATITNVAPSTSGFVLTSNGASADPSFKSVSASGAVIEFTPDSGTTPIVPDASGNVNLNGSGSTTVVGSLNTATFELTGLTNHSVLVGAGTSTITKVALSNQQLLVGNTSADPSGKSLSVNIQVFTSDGTYTPTSGMVYCIIETVGGGGGGGGSTTSGAANGSGGGGGGGGGYARLRASASTIGASQAVTIGAAGTAGTAGGGNGGNGGTTSVGALVSASGGNGGTGSGAGAVTAAAGGSGGVGASGNVNLTGMQGASGWASGAGGLASGGGGGSSFFGGGSQNDTDGTGHPGIAGSSFGDGGGGALSFNSTQQAGGAGAKGVVVVTEYVIS